MIYPSTRSRFFHSILQLAVSASNIPAQELTNLGKKKYKSALISEKKK